tara:strand:+ start:218 stop:433 length:216 start_codon:yes stop_codon:yes gene_type:complete
MRRIKTPPINVEVEQRNRDEHVERMLKRFNKKLKKERILEDCKERQYFTKPSEKRRIERRRRKGLKQNNRK